MRLDRTASLPAASFLQLMWLASPALPVGGFSYSEGLESAIENAGIASESAVATDTDRKFNRMRPSMARVLGLETRSAKAG